MKPAQPFRCIVAAIAVIAGSRLVTAQSSNGLLLPFPAEAAADAETESAPPTDELAVPGRAEPGMDDRNRQDAQRAREMAETFIRRQQMEVANSVPRRAAPPAPVPARAPVTQPAIAARTILPPGGPSSELLPLPGDESIGAPDSPILPNVAGDLPGERRLRIPTDGAASEDVPRDDLAPVPSYGNVEDQDRRGPVFRVDGAHAVAVARARGFKFTPAGGIGNRDGNHTAASQFPRVMTSEVHGTRMSQLQPPPAWSIAETSNTFFMFCDTGYNAVRLAPGWRIRGIKLEGPLWRWVACPRSGSNTASFSIRVYSRKGQNTASNVNLAGLTLEGPAGAVDWKEAFPWINGKGPAASPGPETRPGPEALAATPAASDEPSLPE